MAGVATTRGKAGVWASNAKMEKANINLMIHIVSMQWQVNFSGGSCFVIVVIANVNVVVCVCEMNE